jgi:hypothetical protein
MSLSEANLPTQGKSVEFGIAFGERAGQPVVNFKPSAEMAPPTEYSDRIEWVRQSYERFIEKVLEIEALRGPAAAF